MTFSIKYSEPVTGKIPVDPETMECETDDDLDSIPGPIGFGIPPLFATNSSGESQENSRYSTGDSKLHCDHAALSLAENNLFSVNPYTQERTPCLNSRSESAYGVYGKIPSVRSDQVDRHDTDLDYYTDSLDPGVYVVNEVSVESSYGSLPSVEFRDMDRTSSGTMEKEERTLVANLSSLPLTDDFSKLTLRPTQDPCPGALQQGNFENLATYNAATPTRYHEEETKPFYVGRGCLPVNNQDLFKEDSISDPFGTQYNEGECTSQINPQCLSEVKRSPESITVKLSYLSVASVHSDLGFSSQPENKGNLFDEFSAGKEITPEMTYKQDSDGDTILHIAIIQNLVNLVYFVLNAVPCHTVLDITNSLQQTVLHLAVLTHQPKIVRMLIARGARVDTRDKCGNTALHLASKLGCLDCAKQLTAPVQHSEIGSCLYRVPFQRIPQNPNILNYEGQSCVHLAAESGNINLLSHLLSYQVGHDVNVANGCTGRTLLHNAVQQRNLDMIMFLIQHRVEYKLQLNASAFDGLTPLDAATNSQNDDVALLLSMLGAKRETRDL